MMKTLENMENNMRITNTAKRSAWKLQPVAHSPTIKGIKKVRFRLLIAAVKSLTYSLELVARYKNDKMV